MPIRKLPPLLVSQIAAGEVIERPASVVKELVENSLDAGATHVEITVEQGGCRLIRVHDDGQGIPADELALAAAPHATSKLTSPQQLAAIDTLGFRGEALASIASVSRMRITSRSTSAGQTAEAGANVEASGETVSPVQPVGCAPGCTVEVRDLFFNTPARQKFMRSPTTEFGHIAEIVTRIAMVCPTVGFKLVHNQRTAMEAPPNQTPRLRCVQLLGNDLDDALLEFESDFQAAPDDHCSARTTVWGLAGTPAAARATSKFQYLFVNGRAIRDRNLSHAVKEAYRGLMPPDKQPLAVVIIQTDPAWVDVNVHPTKAEVRFRDPGRIHGHLLAAIRQRLLGTDLTPRVTAKPLTEDHVTPPHARPTQPAATTFSRGINDFVDFFKQQAPTQKGFDFDRVRQAVAPPIPQPQEHAATATIHRPTIAEPRQTGPALTPQPSPAPTQTPGWPHPVLQVHDSYLVTQDDQGLLIIDQHALHERVMFEQLRHRLLDTRNPDGSPRCLESQRLLTPAMVDVSPQRLALLEQLKPLLRRIGIEADPAGPTTVAVHAFPSFLFDRHVDPVQFLEDLLDQAQEGQLEPLTAPGRSAKNEADLNVEEAVLHKALDMMACKAAVKAGDAMSPDELSALLAQREQIERSSSCPHGRPTTIRLTLRDMRKQFKRT